MSKKKQDEEREIITKKERATYLGLMKQIMEEVDPKDLPQEKEMPTIMDNELGEPEGYFGIGGKYFPEMQVRVFMQKKKVFDEYQKLKKMNKEAFEWTRRKQKVLEDRKNNKN